jgi:hypothetical protein
MVVYIWDDRTTAKLEVAQNPHGGDQFKPPPGEEAVDHAPCKSVWPSH